MNCTDQRCPPVFAERSVVAGDTLEIIIDVLDEDDLAWNLTGATIHWQMSRTIGGAALISKSSAAPSEIQLVAPENGRVRVFVSAADWAGIAPGTYKHEAQVTDSEGRKSTVGQGTMRVLAQQIAA